MFSAIPTVSTPSAERRRWFAPIALALAIVLAASMLVLTPKAQAADKDKGGDIFKIALYKDIDSLNPFLAYLAASTSIMVLQYESLIAYSAKDNSVVPGIASKWETSSDGLTWTFTIPEDRKWSDGKPQTAKDVAYTYNAIIDNEKLQQANGGLVTNVASATATDDQTFTIVLEEPQASNPGAELPIVPEHIWGQQAKAEEFKNDKDVVGSGPYVVKSYKQGQSVELVANKNFWRGKAKIDGITYVNYKNADAAVQGLKTGEVDLVSELQPAQFKALKGQKGITTVAGDGRRYQSIAINPGAKDNTGAPLGDGNPALKDRDLRTAIFMAVDSKTLLDKVRDGLGKIGQSEIPPVYPAYFGLEGVEKLKFDPKAANDLLDQAGYKKGSDGIRSDKEGKPLDLRLMGRTSDASHAQMADYIKPWLKDIGINIDVSMVSDNQVSNDSTLGKYDIYFTSWGIGPDPDFQLSINTCDSFPNADGSGDLSENNWCSPEFDKLFAAQHTEQDADKRATLVKQAFSEIYKASVNNVLFYNKYLEAYRSDRFGDFQTQPAKGGTVTFQNGYWGLYSATPAGESSSDDGGFPAWGIALIVVVALLVAGGVVLGARRRSATAGDRE